MALMVRAGNDVEPFAPDSADVYMPLRELAAYSGLSVRTLRGYLRRRARPLPSYRVGGKTLVRRREFDQWVVQFRVNVDRDAVETIVSSMLAGLG